MTSRSLLAADIGQVAYIQPSCAAAEGPHPLPAGSRDSSGVDQMPYNIYMLKQKKGEHMSLERYFHTR